MATAMMMMYGQPPPAMLLQQVAQPSQPPVAPPGMQLLVAPPTGLAPGQSFDNHACLVNGMPQQCVAPPQGVAPYQAFYHPVPRAEQAVTRPSQSASPQAASPAQSKAVPNPLLLHAKLFGADDKEAEKAARLRAKPAAQTLTFTTRPSGPSRPVSPALHSTLPRPTTPSAPHSAHGFGHLPQHAQPLATTTGQHKPHAGQAFFGQPCSPLAADTSAQSGGSPSLTVTPPSAAQHTASSPSSRPLANTNGGGGGALHAAQATLQFVSALEKRPTVQAFVNHYVTGDDSGGGSGGGSGDGGTHSNFIVSAPAAPSADSGAYAPSTEYAYAQQSVSYAASSADGVYGNQMAYAPSSAYTSTPTYDMTQHGNPVAYAPSSNYTSTAVFDPSQFGATNASGGMYCYTSDGSVTYVSGTGYDQTTVTTTYNTVTSSDGQQYVGYESTEVVDSSSTDDENTASDTAGGDDGNGGSGFDFSDWF